MRLLNWRKIRCHSSNSQASGSFAGVMPRSARVGWIVVAIAFCASGYAVGNVQHNDTVSFDIPKQRADLALIAFAEQADRTLLFSFDETKEKTANRLSGTYKVVEALELLLDGTGLSVSMGNRGQLTVAEHSNSSGETEVDKRKSVLGGVAAAVGVLLGGAVQAQEQEEAEDVAAIEEIVVTATKRSQSILEIASSVSAISQEDLELRGIKDMYDIQFAVPSLHFGEILGEQNITIRGVSGFNRQPGVSVSIDGIYQSRTTTSRLSQLDVERVEVLRGPQGTLYGRNSNGGVVNFVTAAPTEAPEGYVRLGYAEFDEIKIQGVYSGPIGDKAAIRVAIDHTDRGDGWVENLVPGEDDLIQGELTNIRAKLALELTDSFRADLVFAKSEIDGPMDHLAWVSLDRDLATFMADGIVSFEPQESYAHPPNDSERDYELYGLTLTWDLPFGSLKSITAYQEYDDFFDMDRANYSVPVFRTPATEKTETFTQEFNLVGETGQLDWVLGAFYMDDDWTSDTQFVFLEAQFGLPAPPILDFQVSEYETTSAAVFLDATWNITDRTRINGGLRYTEDEIDAQHTNAFLIAVPDPLLLFTTCDQRSEEKWNETTFKAAAQHDFNEAHHIYAFYSEGYKSGGIATNECAPAYDPEEIAAVEVGYKASLFGGKTRLAVAGFFYDYSDFQLIQVVELSAVTRNAGEAEVWGGELEIDSILNENWSWSLALTLLDATYEDFVNFDPKNPELGFQQLSGNRLNSSPETSINFGLTYSSPVPWGGTVVVRADVAHRSRTYFREFNEPEDSQDAYTVANLNATWRSRDGTWETRAFAKNLFDEEYLTFILGTGADGGRHGTWAMPRQVGFEVTRRF